MPSRAALKLSPLTPVTTFNELRNTKTQLSAILQNAELLLSCLLNKENNYAYPFFNKHYTALLSSLATFKKNNYLYKAQSSLQVLPLALQKLELARILAYLERIMHRRFETGKQSNTPVFKHAQNQISASIQHIIEIGRNTLKHTTHHPNKIGQRLFSSPLPANNPPSDNKQCSKQSMLPFTQSPAVRRAARASREHRAAPTLFNGNQDRRGKFQCASSPNRPFTTPKPDNLLSYT